MIEIYEECCLPKDKKYLEGIFGDNLMFSDDPIPAHCLNEVFSWDTWEEGEELFYYLRLLAKDKPQIFTSSVYLKKSDMNEIKYKKIRDLGMFSFNEYKDGTDFIFSGGCFSWLKEVDSRTFPQLVRKIASGYQYKILNISNTNKKIKKNTFTYHSYEFCFERVEL